MSTYTSPKFTPEHIETGVFFPEFTCLVDDFAQDLDFRANMVMEGLQLPESDNAIRDDVKATLLKHLVAFANNRDSRNFNFENAQEYIESPVSESPHTIAQLESKIARLEAENLRLREEQSVAALRYKPSRRHKRIFGSLAEYVKFIQHLADIEAFLAEE